MAVGSKLGQSKGEFRLIWQAEMGREQSEESLCGTLFAQMDLYIDRVQ